MSIRGNIPPLSSPKNNVKKMEKAITFKASIDKISSQHLTFKLFAGAGLKNTHAFCGELTLNHKEFIAFIIRLVAYVYVEKKLTQQELNILKELPIVLFDSNDTEKAGFLFSNLIKNNKNGKKV